jgi:hypothetical protein
MERPLAPWLRSKRFRNERARRDAPHIATFLRINFDLGQRLSDCAYVLLGLRAEAALLRLARPNHSMFDLQLSRIPVAL